MSRVLVAVSGGIDSAVSLKLLKDAGRHPQGLFIKMFDGPEATASEEAARRICDRLDVELHLAEATALFKKRVVDYFLDSYLHARTPNPCVVCNPEVKFALLLKWADRLGIESVATGHYASIFTTKRGAGTSFLTRPIDRGKDQTYFLHRLDRSILKRLVFPLAHLRKEQVRKIGAASGLSGLIRSESQEVCFLQDGSRGAYRSFLSRTLPDAARCGPVVDRTGRVLGEHKGLFNYTVGQRRGLGIPDKTPWYVIGLDFKGNRLIVGKEQELYSSSMMVEGLNLLLPYREALFSRCRVKIRYRARPVAARAVLMPDGRMKVEFGTPQRAVTPGQFAVFYKGPLVLGGGEICA